MSRVSIRKQCKLADRKQEGGGVTRQGRAKMTLVMGMEARERCRKRLRDATSVTVALDDCAGRNIVRFRCDTPEPPYVYDGLVGVLSKKWAIENIRDDHAEHSTRLLGLKVKSFWTPIAPKRRHSSRS